MQNQPSRLGGALTYCHSTVAVLLQYPRVSGNFDKDGVSGQQGDRKAILLYLNARYIPYKL